jgi:nifR3 family TIM-barrel protein
MMNSFWKKIKQPIIGQAPMDGITDAAFRYITDKYGHPDVLFTEFIPVEGIVQERERLFSALIHHPSQTPLVAQFVGTTPEAFYKASIIVSKRGFRGIDINMGCPDQNICKKGAGAALIHNPKLAGKIIKAAKKGPLPVSVKTRVGYDRPATKNWISTLLEAEPDLITVHGRVKTQLYSGRADWNEIGKAADLAKNTKTLILGNGDIRSADEARSKSKEYQVNGVLIGRASLGNPWVFQGKEPTLEERFKVMIEHSEKFMEMTPHLNFHSLRKHLAWYAKNFERASRMRDRLMKVNNIDDVKSIIASLP